MRTLWPKFKVRRSARRELKSSDAALVRERAAAGACISLECAMDFELTPEQEAIGDAVARTCRTFDLDYWLKRDRDGGFPLDFHAALARDGWLGIAMPQDYGGAGLGITEAALLMQTIAQSGAGMSGASAVHMNIFS